MQAYEEIIEANLENVLKYGFLPEFPKDKLGKVRHMNFGKKDEEEIVVMVTTDSVSAFDQVLGQYIPFKGEILNKLNARMMKFAGAVVPTAVIDVPDPNVMIQRKLKNIGLENTGIECIVRGYLWGSMADAYETGERNFCGITLPKDLLRYEKLDTPLFTPTTKAEKGHDQNMTFEEMKEKVGEDIANQVKDISLKLFELYSTYADNRNLVLIDTKYEFGKDKDGKIYLIDEATTPDSSRFCEKTEIDKKWLDIKKEMATGKYKNVSDLIKQLPDKKITEWSKQFVRDVLKESGYKEGQPLPELTKEQIIETSLRYIQIYEKFLDTKFYFRSQKNIQRRILDNLVDKEYIYGGCVVLMAASTKDSEHCHKIKKELMKLGLPFRETFPKSAHKETEEVLAYIKKINQSIEPVVIITSAGLSNGLGPVVTGNTKFPVIACNPYKDKTDYAINIHSSLEMPSNLPMGVIVRPQNAALYAKRILDLTR